MKETEAAARTGLANLREKIGSRYFAFQTNRKLESLVKKHAAAIKNQGGSVDSMIINDLPAIAAEGFIGSMQRDQEDEFDENVRLQAGNLMDKVENNNDKAFVARVICGKIALLLYQEAHKNGARQDLATSYELSARRALLYATDITEKLQPEIFINQYIDRAWLYREIMAPRKNIEELGAKISIFIENPPTLPVEI